MCNALCALTKFFRLRGDSVTRLGVGVVVSGRVESVRVSEADVEGKVS